MNLKNTAYNENYLKKLTQSHYDSHHFDFDTNLRYKSFKEEKYLGKILSERKAIGVVLDVGCGAGVLSTYIKKTFAIKRLYAGDISIESLKKAKEKGLVVINLDNLALPFKDKVADVVVSGGVIHHTPNPRKAFSELSRVTKRGGEMWLVVYNKRHPYFYLYTYVGSFFRIIKKIFIGEFLINYVGIFLYYCIYYILQIIVRKNFRPMQFSQAVNMFYDTFMTPIASFHTFEEIGSWAKEENFKIIAKRTEVAGQVLSFRLKKL